MACSRHPLPILDLTLFKERNFLCIMPMMFFVGAQMLAGFRCACVRRGWRVM